MAKTFLLASTTLTLVSGDENNLFGYGNDTTTEANAQIEISESMTFSGLRARIISGGSGTNTFTFRKNGAAGSQVASRAGAGLAEDTTNSDSVVAGDDINIAYTDTGSNSTCAWMAGNVEFASGHGCVHACAAYGGAVLDVASSTRFLAIAGNVPTDAEATEANAQFRNRAYTSIEAMTVRLVANARANDSVFRNRINTANGTGVITFGAGISGELSDDAIGDALADGDLINYSIQLGTGVEDLTLASIVGTYKSTTTKSEIVGWISGLARAASSTATYYTPGGKLESNATAETDQRCKIGVAGKISNLRCYLNANTYTVNGTLKLMVNGVAQLTTTITLLGGGAWYENSTDTFSIDADDEVSFEIDEGTTGSITINYIAATLGPASTDVAVGKASPVVAGLAPGLQDTVPAGAAALTVAGFAPTAATAIPVPAAALTVSGFAPTLNDFVAAPAAALTVSGFAPLLVDAVAVGAASLTVSGFAPTAIVATVVDVPAAALTVSGFAPTVVNPVNVVVPAAQPTVAGFAPTVVDLILVVAAGPTVAGFAPLLTAGIGVSAAQLVVAGLAPALVDAVAVPASAPTVAGLAPVAQLSVAVNVPAASLTVAGFAPVASATNNVTVEVDRASITASGQGPTLADALAVAAAAPVIAGFAPARQDGVAAGAASLIVAGQAPMAALTSVLGVGAASLLIAGFAPAVGGGLTELPVPLAQLAMAGFAPALGFETGVRMTDVTRRPRMVYNTARDST